MKTLVRICLLLPAVALAGCGVIQLDDPEIAAPKVVEASIASTPKTDWDRIADLPWPQQGQTAFKSYEDTRRVYWKKLYPTGGTELYCGVSFDGARVNAAHENLSIEHAYPADAIAETEATCTDRTCKVPRVQYAMADLQNLWPALQRVNSSRSRLRFGEVDDEPTARRFTEFCPDFERTSGAKALVEPREGVKGDLARSLVYMHFVYGLPLANAVSDKDILLTWMREDPPDTEEMRRNALIDQLQGTPNPLLMQAFAGM
jgi:deoxyribonuclease I